MRNGKIEEMPFFMLLGHLFHLTKYRAVSRFGKFDLKPNQAGILFVLDCEGGLSQRELAERIGVKPPSMTVAIQKLERLGYVSRTCDKEDQRIIRIALTEKGKNCVKEVKTIAFQTEEELLQGFSQEEKILLRRFLIQMMENMMTAKDMKKKDMEALMKEMRDRMAAERPLCD